MYGSPQTTTLLAVGPKQSWVYIDSYSVSWEQLQVSWEIERGSGLSRTPTPYIVLYLMTGFQTDLRPMYIAYCSLTWPACRQSDQMQTSLSLFFDSFFLSVVFHSLTTITLPLAKFQTSHQWISKV